MNKPWYKEWFNSPYYHLLYRHRDNHEAKIFLNNLQKTLHFKSSSHILDLACGRGRHAIYLNSLGFEVTGVDLSEANIRYASQYKNDRLHFAIHDMKEVYKPQAFDVVLNLFTSFGYFRNDDENQQVISSVFTMLNPGGIFVLDYLNVTLLQLNKQVQEIKIDDVEFHTFKYIENNRIIKQIQVIDSNNQYFFYEKVKYYTADTLCMMIENENMKIRNIYGNYQLSTFNPSISERVIIVSVK